MFTDLGRVASPTQELQTYAGPVAKEASNLWGPR